jgi:predicted nucleic acid-binding protein
MNVIYLDSCASIYLVEAASPFHASVVDKLRALRGGASAVLATSRLSLLECRTRPLRDNDQALLAAYDAFFRAQSLRIVELDAAVIDRATALRAKYGLKTPDALHLASAAAAGASVFLTGDAALSRCAEVKVEVL